MPPRHITLIIVAFWVAMSGWLFYRDLWPRLRPGEPPPYLIDLMDEARAKETNITWIVYQSDVQSGYARTSVVYNPPDDTFNLKGEFKLKEPKSTEEARLEIHSSYKVTRDGALQEIDAEVWVRELRLGGVNVRVRIHGTFHGEIRDGQLYSHCRVDSPLHDLNDDLPPIPVSQRGSVLNPLQPLNRLHGLRVGQHWRVPLMNPLAGVLPGSTPDVQFLEADVRQGLFSLNGGGIPCYVIDYQGNEITGKTWVRQSDNTVLQQEASFSKSGLSSNLVLKRDNIQP
jgi:hypothetical protein